MPYFAIPDDAHQKLLNHIDSTNAEFLAADRATKRVMLAKDVIKQIDLGAIHPASAYYEGELEEAAYRAARACEESDFREELRKFPTCTVCGIGAVFVTAVHRLNVIKTTPLTQAGLRDAMIEYIEEFGLFTKGEMLTIEDFFEGSARLRSHSDYHAPSWGLVCMPSSPRMVHIMKTIIDTKGEAAITLDLLLSTPQKTTATKEEREYGNT